MAVLAFVEILCWFRWWWWCYVLGRYVLSTSSVSPFSFLFFPKSKLTLFLIHHTLRVFLRNLDFRYTSSQRQSRGFRVEGLPFGMLGMTSRDSSVDEDQRCRVTRQHNKAKEEDPSDQNPDSQIGPVQAGTKKNTKKEYVSSSTQHIKPLKQC